MGESPQKMIGILNQAYDTSILPAISGKAYRILGVFVNIEQAAAKTGEIVCVQGIDPANGSYVSLINAYCVPGVANAVNFYVPCNFLCKSGRPVKLYYADHTGAQKDIGDFSAVGVNLFYTEVE